MLRESGHSIPPASISLQHPTKVLARTLPMSEQTRHLERLGKRSLDIGVAGTALFLLLPLLLLIGLLVWAGDRKAPIFRHMRIGRRGRRFACLKFRSMVTDGDAVLRAHLATDPIARREWEETHKLTNDPRVTPLGSVLRKTSLDELPQLERAARRDEPCRSASHRLG
jgi:exopolysaccharide production protein ExoY